jgi:hypothetical protein
MNTARESSANSFQVTPARSSQRATGRSHRWQALRADFVVDDSIYGIICLIYGFNLQACFVPDLPAGVPARPASQARKMHSQRPCVYATA